MGRRAWIRPDVCFVAFASLLGMACLVLTPPFQVADEPNHFFRIVQIAQGGIVGERRGAESGGEIPVALVSMAGHFIDGNMASGEVRWERSRWANVRPYLQQRADLTATRFQDFRAMTRYAPVAYLPQLVGIWFAEALNLPPLWLVYIGRFCALVFFIWLVYRAIRATPICPWGFAVLALLPAVMFQAASLSADSATTALLFFFVAQVFRLAFAAPSATRRETILLVFLGVLIGLCKSVYVLATGLVFLIPASKFGGRRNWGWVCAAVVAGALLAAAAWTAWMKSAYVPSFGDVDEWAQLSLMVRHPMRFLDMLVGRVLRSVGYLYLGGGLGLCHEFVGLLGWYAACVNIGQTSFAVLFWCAIAEKNDRVEIRGWHRWLTGIVLASQVLGIAAANYVTWCPPGWPALALFGRYFHPIAPAAFLLLHNRSFRPQAAEKWRACIPVYFLGVVFATAYVLVHTY